MSLIFYNKKLYLFLILLVTLLCPKQSEAQYYVSSKNKLGVSFKYTLSLNTKVINKTTENDRVVTLNNPYIGWSLSYGRALSKAFDFNIWAGLYSRHNSNKLFSVDQRESDISESIQALSLSIMGKLSRRRFLGIYPIAGFGLTYLGVSTKISNNAENSANTTQIQDSDINQSASIGLTTPNFYFGGDFTFRSAGIRLYLDNYTRMATGNKDINSDYTLRYEYSGRTINLEFQAYF